MSNIILISGKKQNGKTSLARLISCFGYGIASLAAGLKELEHIVYEIKYPSFPSHLYFPEDAKRIIKEMGFEDEKARSKLYQEILYAYDNPKLHKVENGKRRYALQYIGTDILKREDSLCHLKYLWKHNRDAFMGKANLVIDDARFPEELEMRKYLKHSPKVRWTNVFVERTGFLNEDNHQSEKVLPVSKFKYDYVIKATNLVELYTSALDQMKNLLLKEKKDV